MKVATILMTAPKKAGDPTWYTSMWAQKMENLARSLKYNVITLKGNDTTYKKVTDAIEAYNPKLFVHSGHGCPSALNGQNECIVTRKFSIDEMVSMSPEQLDKLFNPVKLSGCGKDICKLESDLCSPFCNKDTNIHLLNKNKSIVYAVACHSLEQLGRCAVQYGVGAYVGYRDLLLFPVDGMRSQDMFGDIHIEFLRYLLTGYSVGESYQATGELEDTYIRLYKDIKWTALPMVWNALHRGLLGDPDLRMY
jgi:hypothetical protein